MIAWSLMIAAAVLVLTAVRTRQEWVRAACAVGGVFAVLAAGACKALGW